MTTTFEEAWFENYLSNQTCINLTEISLGWISSLKTSLNPFKNSSGPQVNLCWECQISANFQGRGTFCRYLARDKISTFHILTCLPLCNLINLILNLYLRFFFFFLSSLLCLFLTDEWMRWIRKGSGKAKSSVTGSLSTCAEVKVFKKTLAL